MAAQVIIRRNNSSRGNAFAKPNESNIDRDDELQAAIRNAGLEKPKSAREANKLSDGPVHISHDTLMGKMPKADKIIKKGDLWKLTSSYDWKPMTAALTAVGLFLSRPGEELLKDLIPLYEVVEVKKRTDIPGESSNNQEETGFSNEPRNSANARSMRLSSLINDSDEPIHMIQLRTIENGYNSGRTYYFKADTEEECNEWISHLETVSDNAVMLKQAGPSTFRRIRYRIRKLYESSMVQTLVAMLIFTSFLVNILQTEMLGSQPAEDSPTFTALEYFFTIAFAIEVSFNFLANCFRPFFQVATARPLRRRLSSCFATAPRFNCARPPKRASDSLPRRTAGASSISSWSRSVPLARHPAVWIRTHLRAPRGYTYTARAGAHTHTNTDTQTHRHTDTHTHTQTHRHTHTHKHKDTHTSTRARMRTRTHAHKHRCAPVITHGRLLGRGQPKPRPEASRMRR